MANEVVVQNEGQQYGVVPAPQPQAPSPRESIEHVFDVAEACRDLVVDSTVRIQGREYIKVEGWQTIALVHGCVPSVLEVTETEDGIYATAVVRRISDGVEIARAIGFVGNDESSWAKRPRYARISMAETRAMSRACRTAFAHVVVALARKTGRPLSPTPAEEITEDLFNGNGRPTPQRPAPPSTQPAQRSPAPPAPGKREKMIRRIRELAEKVGERVPESFYGWRDQDLIEFGQALRAEVDRREAGGTQE